MDHEQPVAGEVGSLTEIVTDLISGLGVLAHHEKHGSLTGGGEGLVALPPAAYGDVEPLAIALHRRRAELHGGTVDFTNKWGFDDSICYGRSEGIVDYDVSEDPPGLILGSG